MKIERFRKLKDNRYEIYFDDDSKLILYDDIIVKYSLIARKDITKSVMDKILEENDSLVSYYLAIKYINTKLRSEKEIRFYLEKKGISFENIDSTIARLKDSGFLKSELYIKSFINDQINLSMNGYYKILRDLENKGFDEVEILKYLNNIDMEVWQNKLKKLVRKKIKMNRKYGGKRLLEKLEYDFINLGYQKTMVNDVLSNINIADDDLLEKEFLKLQNKLAKKYEGKILKNQIKTKLLLKGFSIDDINKIFENF